MKKTYSFALITLFFLTSCGNSHINQFYNKHRWKKGTTNFSVPGWVIWTATGIANEGTDDKKKKSFYRMAKKIKGIKFLVAEDGRRISKEDVKHLVKRLKNDKFEDLLFIKDGESTVSMMIEEKNDKIKNLFFLIDDDGRFIMMNMRTKLKVKELKNAIRLFQNEWKKKEKNRKIKIPEVPKFPLKRV